MPIPRNVKSKIEEKDHSKTVASIPEAIKLEGIITKTILWTQV